MSDPNQFDETSGLRPDQEAIVRHFSQQLDADGNSVMMMGTPVGPIKMAPEDEKAIREAARDKAISLISATPPTRREVVGKWLGGAGWVVFYLLALAYLAKWLFF